MESAQDLTQQRPDARIGVVIAIVVAAWGIAVAWTAATGVLLRIYMPLIALLVATGIVMPVLAYALLARVRKYVEALGLFPLTLLHIWRVPAALAFFAYGLAGQLPTLFWVLAGVGDLLAGLYAARLLWARGDARFYWRFHLFGFADFVVAVATGLAFTLLQDPRMSLIASLPMALIPLFGVGLSGASHLIAFDMLRRGVGYRLAQPGRPL